MVFPWFRLYNEARTDPKLRHLADDEHRVWFDLLCYASEQKERGLIENVDRFLLAMQVARGDEELLDRTLKMLVRLRIITVQDDTITFINFLERQYDKPSDMPQAVRERVAKHRARVAQPDAGVTQSDVTPGNAHPALRRNDRVTTTREDGSVVGTRQVPDRTNAEDAPTNGLSHPEVTPGNALKRDVTRILDNTREDNTREDNTREDVPPTAAPAEPPRTAPIIEGIVVTSEPSSNGTAPHVEAPAKTPPTAAPPPEASTPRAARKPSKTDDVLTRIATLAPALTVNTTTADFVQVGRSNGSAALIAEAYVALATGVWGDQFELKNLSLRFVCTRLNGYQAWKQQVRPKAREPVDFASQAFEAQQSRLKRHAMGDFS